MLFAIPHYYNPDPARGGRHGSLGRDPAPRARALADSLAAIQQLFGRPQCAIDIARRTTAPANRLTAASAFDHEADTAGEVSTTPLEFGIASRGSDL